MKQFNFSGIVGWDVTPSDVRDFLQEAGGEEVEFLISSPGGFVSYGLEIFNMVRNYAGHVTAVLSGYAMSMASYIPLAADKIVVEDNAVFMIHNVHGGVFGDHNYILKYGKETAALSKLLAMAYVRHTGKPLEEIQHLMDEETYFYGAEIVEEGFAHELVDTEDDGDQEGCMAAARTAFQACSQRLAKDTTAAAEDLSKASAIAAANKDFKTEIDKRAVTPTPKTKEQEMDLQTLKSKHPDLVVALSEETIGGLDMETLRAGNSSLADGLVKAGAEIEVARIKDVRAQLVPGHEKLIEKMELDGESTGADAALAIVAAEQELRKNAGVDLEEESNGIVPPAKPDDGEKKEMKREDFDSLSMTDQRAFSQGGGVVKD